MLILWKRFMNLVLIGLTNENSLYLFISSNKQATNLQRRHASDNYSSQEKFICTAHYHIQCLKRFCVNNSFQPRQNNIGKNIHAFIHDIKMAETIMKRRDKEM